MKIMYVSCNPAAARELSTKHEITEIQKRVMSGPTAKDVTLLPFLHLDPTELALMVADHRPDVLHLAAHGDGHALILEGAEGRALELDDRNLGNLLAGVSHRPALIVLNACSSDTMAERLAKAGTADHVVGVDAPISNGAAITMAATLYSRLAHAETLQAAFDTAAANLDLDGGRKVQACLHSAPGSENAADIRLVHRLGILASFPDIDVSLVHGLTSPDPAFRPERPSVWFMLAGVPDDALQSIIFSDDEKLAISATVRPETFLFASRKRPVDGQLKFVGTMEFYGDANLHACVTTVGRSIRCTSSSLISALQRNYFEHKSGRHLPEEISLAIEGSLRLLRRYGHGRD